MTIKSDKWIRAQCEQPTHIVKLATGGTEYASEPFTNTQAFLQQHNDTLNELLISNRKSPSNSEVVEFTEIRPLTLKEQTLWKPMIEPFVNGSVREENGKKILSYGLSSFGYDVRLANQFKLFTNINSTIIDPLEPQQNCYVDQVGDYCIIPPNSYLLGHTVEYFRIPRDVLVICMGKSTLARLGLQLNITPVEPGFEGQVVIEISNSTNIPVKVYANQGVAQFLFLQSDEPCAVSYKDRSGKYQGQTGITTARL